MGGEAYVLWTSLRTFLVRTFRLCPLTFALPTATLYVYRVKKKRGQKNKRICDLREKRHKGVEKGDKAFLESQRKE